jgi:hypothetical protein
MKRLLAAAVSSLLLAVPAIADGKIYVQLPDLSGYEGPAAEDLLERVVRANVISSNCPGYPVAEEEWSLLVDSADIVAYGRLGLSVDDFDALYYGPAFAALDEPGACERHGPDVQPTLDLLISLGGSRVALPDQDAAYAAAQARQAAWDAAGGNDRKSKQK